MILWRISYSSDKQTLETHIHIRSQSITMENQFTKRPRLSSEPNRRTHHKNELCIKFQRGSCDYGNTCCFAHSNEEFRGFENENPRSIEKTKLCWKFMNGEKCPFGDNCHFVHVKGERTNAAVDENDELMQRKAGQWRTKLCNRWMMTGSCRYGMNCCFAHGESELQNQEPCKLVDTKVMGKQLKVKWTNYEKISGVYADWINDMPLVFHTI